MFLPPPETPTIKDGITVYHLYPMDTELGKDDFWKDARGTLNKRVIKRSEIAYFNIVVPMREAEAYRKAKGYVDFGFKEFVCDKTRMNIHYHNFYGLDDNGGRYLTSIVGWHKEVYDGTNPDARVVIGSQDVLIRALSRILKSLTDMPFLNAHVPDIMMQAKSYGLISFKGSNNWVSPIWYIRQDLTKWNKIIEEYFKRMGKR
jgi:hypothetical protein